MNLHDEQDLGKDASEFPVLGQVVGLGEFLLLLRLLWRASCTEQTDAHGPAGLEVVGDASSIPRYLFF